MTFRIIYAPEAADDLRSIYSYIAYEKLAPEHAEGQINRIRNAIRKLDLFPDGHAYVNWEPWLSMGMHFVPVDNYTVYYLVDEDQNAVKIVRIFYSGRDVENIVRKHLE